MIILLPAGRFAACGARFASACAGAAATAGDRPLCPAVSCASPARSGVRAEGPRAAERSATVVGCMLDGPGAEGPAGADAAGADLGPSEGVAAGREACTGAG